MSLRITEVATDKRNMAHRKPLHNMWSRCWRARVLPDDGGDGDRECEFVPVE
jgi:hypothetical protein